MSKHILFAVYFDHNGCKILGAINQNRNHYKLSIIDHQIITSIYIFDYFSISGLALKDFCFPLVAEIPYSMTILMPKTTDRPTIQRGNMVQASYVSAFLNMWKLLYQQI